MYVDLKDTRNMEQEVNEATAKLKGLLGIGAITGHDAAEAVAVPQQKNTDATPGAGKPPKNKRKNRNKQNSRQRAGRDAQPQQQQQPPTLQHQDPAQGHSPKDGPKKDANKKAKGKKPTANSKRNVKDKDNTKVSSGGKNEKDPKSNFAWSAFQSSPDASNLPVPAFSPFANPKNEVGITTEAAQQHAESALASLLPVTNTSAAEISLDLENVPKAEDLEEQVISAAKKHSESVGGETKDDTAQSEPPPSKTGINLAALTSANTDSSVAGSGPTQSSSGSGPPEGQQQAGQMRGIYQQQFSPHMNYQYHHPHHHNPYQQQMHNPYGPPPGFMTIQVQVPPILMPGRQMIVQSPAGYPVQVVVPEGIPPGMVIPVHVPAGPPLHMMPPQQHQPNYHQHHQQPHHQQQQSYYRKGDNK